jgi:hypothetical protein
MMITSTEKLKNSILKANPQADATILEELCFLVRKHQLKWVARGSKYGAYFIMSQLSTAKGLDSDDYKSHWATRCGRSTPSESLPGEALKLEGEKLATFKKLYQETYGVSLGRINSLYIGDWLHAYSYLVQGSTQTARDFQKLGAKAVEVSTQRDIEDITKPVEQVTKTHLYQSGWGKEEHLQRDLCYLASMTPYKVSAEVSVEDYPGSKSETRRFDLVHIQPHKSKGKVVTVYELKKDVISLEDLVTTVLAKRYLKLAKEKYGTEHVNLVLVAPYGGTAEALEACQAPEYDGVEIQTVRKFTQFLLEKARAYHSKDQYFVDRILVGQNETVQKLLTPPKDVQTLKNVIPFPVKKLAA